jgi:hypothetical protein
VCETTHAVCLRLVFRTATTHALVSSRRTSAHTRSPLLQRQRVRDLHVANFLPRDDGKAQAAKDGSSAAPNPEVRVRVLMQRRRTQRSAAQRSMLAAQRPAACSQRASRLRTLARSTGCVWSHAL